MIKIIFSLLYLISAQNIYNGQITFNYNGTENGYFNSIIEDSIKTSILINQEISDSASIIIGSITEQEENNFDIFISIFQDTIFPIQARTWDIPGQGDENNPLSLEALTIFMPGIDSSFAIEIFNIITDSTNLNDSINLEEIISNFSNDIYIGISGELNINFVNDSIISGEFNTVMLKPAFYFPPHIITIDNGSITLNKLTIPSLSTNTNNLSPSDIKLTKCYPNPFNSEINIYFSTNNQNTSISIYNLNGKLIKTFNQKFPKTGYHLITWDANNSPSGLYIIKLISDNYIDTKKIIYLK